MNDWQEKIHAYADDECDAEEKQAVENHLANDAGATNELKWAQELPRLVASRCQVKPCEETWKKAMSRLDAIDKTRRTEFVVAKFGWAFCGVFLVSILAAGAMNRMVGGRVLSGTQMSSMFDSLRPVSQPTETMGARLPVQIFEGSPIIFVPSGTAIVDARTGRFNDKTVGSMTMRDREGMLSLLMVAGMDKVEGIEPAPFGDKYAVGMFNGRMCATWKQGDYTVLLMGDRPTEELKALAARLVPEDQAQAGQ